MWKVVVSILKRSLKVEARILSILIGIGLFSNSSYALEALTDDDVVLGVESRELVYSDFTEKYRLYHVVNANSEKEVRVELIMERSYLPDTKHIVLIGRDIDEDGLYDLWFVPNGDGEIEPQRLKAHRENGWDAITNILIVQNKLKRESLLVTSGEILMSLTLVASHVESVLSEVVQMEMDLFDLEYRVQDRMEKGADPRQALEDLKIIQMAWKKIDEKISKQGFQDYILWQAGDLGLVYIGGIVLKGGGIAAKWVGGKIISTAAGRAAADVGAKILAGMAKVVEKGKGSVAAKLAKLDAYVPISKLIPSKSTGWVSIMLPAEEFAKLTTSQMKRLLSLKISVTPTIRKQLVPPMLKMLEQTYILARAGVGEWKYQLSSMSAQFIAESVTRRDELFDWNPIVVAKNYANNDEMIYNMTYMSFETFLMAGVHSTERSTFNKLGTCFVIGAVDSTGMNVIYKGETDKTRIIGDGVWESVIGNTQVKLDLAAKKYFYNMANRTGKGKYKFVGLAFGFADQLTGYTLYSLLSQWYTDNKKEVDSLKKATGIEDFNGQIITPDKLKVYVRPVFMSE